MEKDNNLDLQPIGVGNFGDIYDQFRGRVKEAFAFLIAHQSGDLVSENIDKAVLQIGSRLVTLRRNYRIDGKKIADKNWVLTAYDEKAADGGSAITVSN